MEAKTMGNLVDNGNESGFYSEGVAKPLEV